MDHATQFAEFMISKDFYDGPLPGTFHGFDVYLQLPPATSVTREHVIKLVDYISTGQLRNNLAHFRYSIGNLVGAAYHLMLFDFNTVNETVRFLESEWPGWLVQHAVSFTSIVPLLMTSLRQPNNVPVGSPRWYGYAGAAKVFDFDCICDMYSVLTYLTDDMVYPLMSFFAEGYGPKTPGLRRLKVTLSGSLQRSTEVAFVVNVCQSASRKLLLKYNKSEVGKLIGFDFPVTSDRESPAVHLFFTPDADTKVIESKLVYDFFSSSLRNIYGFKPDMSIFKAGVVSQGQQVSECICPIQFASLGTAFAEQTGSKAPLIIDFPYVPMTFPFQELDIETAKGSPCYISRITFVPGKQTRLDKFLQLLYAGLCSIEVLDIKYLPLKEIRLEATGKSLIVTVATYASHGPANTDYAKYVAMTEEILHCCARAAGITNNVITGYMAHPRSKLALNTVAKAASTNYIFSKKINVHETVVGKDNEWAVAFVKPKAQQAPSKKKQKRAAISAPTRLPDPEPEPEAVEAPPVENKEKKAESAAQQPAPTRSTVKSAPPKAESKSFWANKVSAVIPPAKPASQTTVPPAVAVEKRSPITTRRPAPAKQGKEEKLVPREPKPAKMPAPPVKDEKIVEQPPLVKEVNSVKKPVPPSKPVWNTGKAIDMVIGRQPTVTSQPKEGEVPEAKDIPAKEKSRESLAAEEDDESPETRGRNRTPRSRSPPSWKASSAESEVPSQAENLEPVAEEKPVETVEEGKATEEIKETVEVETADEATSLIETEVAVQELPKAAAMLPTDNTLNQPAEKTEMPSPAPSPVDSPATVRPTAGLKASANEFVPRGVSSPLPVRAFPQQQQLPFRPAARIRPDFYPDPLVVVTPLHQPLHSGLQIGNWSQYKKYVLCTIPYWAHSTAIHVVRHVLPSTESARFGDYGSAILGIPPMLNHTALHKFLGWLSTRTSDLSIMDNIVSVSFVGAKFKLIDGHAGAYLVLSLKNFSCIHPVYFQTCLESVFKLEDAPFEARQGKLPLAPFAIECLADAAFQKTPMGTAFNSHRWTLKHRNEPTMLFDYPFLASLMMKTMDHRLFMAANGALFERTNPAARPEPHPESTVVITLPRDANDGGLKVLYSLVIDLLDSTMDDWELPVDDRWASFVIYTERIWFMQTQEDGPWAAAFQLGPETPAAILAYAREVCSSLTKAAFTFHDSKSKMDLAYFPVFRDEGRPANHETRRRDFMKRLLVYCQGEAFADDVAEVLSLDFVQSLDQQFDAEEVWLTINVFFESEDPRVVARLVSQLFYLPRFSEMVGTVRKFWVQRFAGHRYIAGFAILYNKPAPERQKAKTSDQNVTGNGRTSGVNGDGRRSRYNDLVELMRDLLNVAGIADHQMQISQRLSPMTSIDAVTKDIANSGYHFYHTGWTDAPFDKEKLLNYLARHQEELINEDGGKLIYLPVRSLKQIAIAKHEASRAEARRRTFLPYTRANLQIPSQRMTVAPLLELGPNHRWRMNYRVDDSWDLSAVKIVVPEDKRGSAAEYIVEALGSLPLLYFASETIVIDRPLQLTDRMNVAGIFVVSHEDQVVRIIADILEHASNVDLPLRSIRLHFVEFWHHFELQMVMGDVDARALSKLRAAVPGHGDWLKISW